MQGIFQHMDRALELWARRMFKALHRRKATSAGWPKKMQAATSRLFYQWREALTKVG
jgi:hypothetical protein